MGSGAPKGARTRSTAVRAQRRCQFRKASAQPWTQGVTRQARGGESAQAVRRRTGLEARRNPGGALRPPAAFRENVADLPTNPGAGLGCDSVVGGVEGQAGLAHAVRRDTFIATLVLDVVQHPRVLREQNQGGQSMQQPDAGTVCPAS